MLDLNVSIQNRVPLVVRHEIHRPTAIVGSGDQKHALVLAQARHGARQL
jgi:hypothetical protein